jgi:hypothetical protein
MKTMADLERNNKDVSAPTTEQPQVPAQEIPEDAKKSAPLQVIQGNTEIIQLKLLENINVTLVGVLIELRKLTQGK